MNLIRERPLLFRIRFENSGLNGWLLFIFFFFEKKPRPSSRSAGVNAANTRSQRASPWQLGRRNPTELISHRGRDRPVRVQRAYPCVCERTRHAWLRKTHKITVQRGGFRDAAATRVGSSADRTRDASSFEADR